MENYTRVCLFSYGNRRRLLQTVTWPCMISGCFCRIPVEICALLGYYAAWSGKSLLTFRDNVPVSSSRYKKSKTDRWSRNAGKELSLYAAQYPRRVRISITAWILVYSAWWSFSFTTSQKVRDSLRSTVYLSCYVTVNTISKHVS